MVGSVSAENDRQSDHADRVALLGVFEKTLGVGLAGLGLFDQCDHAGEGRVLGRARHAGGESAHLVLGPRKERIPGPFRDGEGFARDRTLVDGTFALRHFGVERHLFAGAQEHDVIHDDIAEGEVDEMGIAADMRGLRPKLRQGLDRVARPTHRVGLQDIGKRKKKEQHGAFEGRAHRRRPQSRQDHEEVNIDIAFAQRFVGGNGPEIATREVAHDIEHNGHHPETNRVLDHRAKNHRKQGEGDEHAFHAITRQPVAQSLERRARPQG